MVRRPANRTARSVTRTQCDRLPKKTSWTLSRLGSSLLAWRVVERRRLVVWIGGVAVLAAAVVALRHTPPPAGTDATPTAEPAPANHVARFALEGVLLPEPSAPPAPPTELVAVPNGPDRVRVAWGLALPGGSEPANAVGYEVSWRGGNGSQEQQRMVAAPEVQLNGLTGEHYAVQVRSVDAFGRRSAPTSTDVQIRDEPRPGPPWSGLFESFDGPLDVDTASSAARWHFT